jgi:LysM repeat protein
MFVRAVYYCDKKTVHYFNEDNEETLYIGGSFAWRMNNPGNLAKPGRRVIPGVIGYAQRTSSKSSLFCIFENPEAGEKARIILLKEVYGKSTIASMMEKYAPRPENDTDGYIAFLCEKANVPKTTVVGDMSPAQFNAMAKAMEVKEGNFAGKIVKLGKPKNVALRDMVQQPIAEKEVQLTSGADAVMLKTDANGTLPALYPDLFSADLSFHFGNPTFGIGTEKIGTISNSVFKSDLTFVAPYFITASVARPHETEVPEQALVHIVKSGETLTGIAAKYGVSRDALARANDITDINQIFDRQHLTIPPRGAVGSATTADQADVSHKTSLSSSVAHPPPPSAKTAHAPNPLGQAVSPPTLSTSHPAPPRRSTSLPPATKAQGKAVSVEQQRTDKKHPVTVLSSSTLIPSGAAWCQRFPGSKSLDSLNENFKPKAKGFIRALEAAGVKVVVRAAHRPIERSYLMYYAFQICRGFDVTKIPAYVGINIDWAHRNADGKPNPAAAKQAAEAMCSGYSINPHSSKQLVGKPGNSRHNYAAAVDMNITQYIGKLVKNKAGDEVKLNSFKDLKELGANYGVKYFPKENMHWSDTGG